MTATWSTPSDFATSHIVTSPEWNALNGASGNLAFLNEHSQTSYASTSRGFSTVYQNTTGRLLHVAVGLTLSTTTTAASAIARASSMSTSPPSTLVDDETLNNFTTVSFTTSLHYEVLPSNYYTVSTGGTGTVTWQRWVESY